MIVPAEDRRQVATVIDGREYRARNGYFDMPDRHAKAHLRDAGYGQSWHIPGIPKGGRVCGSCGFVGFFVTCSRCGGTCERTP